MKEYILFFKQKPILAFLGFVVGLEFFLQSGCYKSLLKPQSYAANANRITQNAIAKKDKLNPDILVVGTSLAQEGVLLSSFNDALVPIGKKVASIAIPGSETLAQNLATEKVFPKLEKVKVVIHIVELERPWADEQWLESVNLPMIAEFDKFLAYSLVKKYEYDFSFKDLSFLLFKSIAYRKDIGDFLLNPPKRIKSVQRANKKQMDSLYFYENEYTENIALYNLSSLKECLEKTSPENRDPPAKDSSLPHKKAINDTCKLMTTSKVSNKETITSAQYFKRLKLFYDSIRNRKINVVSVFSPTNRLAVFPEREVRFELWRKRLKEIGVDEIFELQDMFPEKEGDKYFYDLFHMNKDGAKIFTEELSKSVLKSTKLFGESNAL